MRTTCGLDGSAAAPALAGSCASADCAARLLGVLDDCAASVGHASGRDAAFYAALEGSALYASCAELDHSAAAFATLQVEFRAPSRLVADRLVAEHEELAAGIATMCAAEK